MANPFQTVAYHTLGCKLNFSETSTISRILDAEGLSKVDFSSGADVYIINTCSVTENADRECRSVVRRALSKNPEAIIAITGCFAQLKPNEISEIPGVDLVVGANDKFNLINYLNEVRDSSDTIVKACDIQEVDGFIPSWSEGDRTRVFLKVQDGCDYSCSFCTIPLARGKSRSNTIENVIEQIDSLQNKGAKEIVLTGINLGDFGLIPGSTKRSQTFTDLIYEIDQNFTDGRFRISSIEPNLLTDEIIELVGSGSSIVPHFHIPLQSGSEKILKLMRRRYTKQQYHDRITKIKSLIPDCCIGVDVIVGFPGESDADFQETFDFLHELPVSYLHVFTYSERNDTLAAKMQEVIPIEVRKERNKRLRRLSSLKQNEFYRSQLGGTYDVLFESDNKKGMMHGFTPNYVKVEIPYDPSYVNKLKSCTLKEIGPEGSVVVNQLESNVLA
jgi:threonylcarbamoyladenosine tRNA methylthiotransferase MtaB